MITGGVHGEFLDLTMSPRKISDESFIEAMTPEIQEYRDNFTSAMTFFSQKNVKNTNIPNNMKSNEFPILDSDDTEEIPIMSYYTDGFTDSDINLTPSDNRYVNKSISLINSQNLDSGCRDQGIQVSLNINFSPKKRSHELLYSDIFDIPDMKRRLYVRNRQNKCTASEMQSSSQSIMFPHSAKSTKESIFGLRNSYSLLASLQDLSRETPLPSAYTGVTTNNLTSEDDLEDIDPSVFLQGYHHKKIKV